MPVVLRGTVIRCSQGHEVCEAVADIYFDDTGWADKFGKWRGVAPTLGGDWPKCPECGEVVDNAGFHANFRHTRSFLVTSVAVTSAANTSELAHIAGAPGMKLPGMILLRESFIDDSDTLSHEVERNDTDGQR